MNKKPELELTEGSTYKIISMGGRDSSLESKGVFKGFISIGIDEIGLIMELDKSHGEMKGKIRIIPLHVILAIDVYDVKPNDKKDKEKEMPNYVG
jgi:hypothetical protein